MLGFFGRSQKLGSSLLERMDKYRVSETQIDPHLLNDVSKEAFILPQILMQMISIWNVQDYLSRFAFFIKLGLMVFLEIGQLIYFAVNLSDLTKLTSTMSTLSTTLQAIVKLTILYIYSDRISKVVDAAYNDFWPSNFMGPTLQATLKSTTKMVVTSMTCLIISAVVFAVGFLTKPLIEGSGRLPFESWYPFDWTQSPIYEIVYLLQVFVNFYIIIISILSHDFFFLALCSNVIAQYKLLKMVMRKIGSGEEARLNVVLGEFKGVDVRLMDEEDAQEKMLMVKCVVHHNLLLRISDEMRLIFAPSLFIQMAASVTAICVSSFLITVAKVDQSQLYQLSSYCMGHVLQLFMICAAGNELSYQSSTLGSYAFDGGWHLKKYSDIRKSLMMVIRRCQRASKLTALDIFDLDYNTFVTVMRLSFSFYTLLSTIIENRNE